MINTQPTEAEKTAAKKAKEAKEAAEALAATQAAAAVVNAVGLNVNDTNINKTTAWKKGQQVRLHKAKEIKENFVVPENGQYLPP